MVAVQGCALASLDSRCKILPQWPRRVVVKLRPSAGKRGCPVSSPSHALTDRQIANDTAIKG